MDWQKIHLIKNNNSYIVFYYPKSKIKIVNELVYSLILRFQQGKDIHDVSKEINISEEKINDFIESFEKSLGESKEDKSITGDESVSQNRVANRIMLHVSNDCNLRCKYCYANGGDYHLPRQLMNFLTADNFIQFCINQFDRIESVVFFGGEPLLNVEVMNYICERFRFYSEEGSFHMPKLGIITNGTILSPSILNFIEQYMSSITVSIDGDKAMNDKNRIFSNGNGSFDKISRFIKTVQKVNPNIHYEATYTLDHYQANYSHKDIKDYMFAEFGIGGIVVNEKNSKLTFQLTEKYWSKILDNILSYSDFDEINDDFWEVLSLIVNEGKHELCSVVENNFAVNVNGDIYACHLLNGNADNSLGNVSGENVFNTPSKYTEFLNSIKFSKSEKCKKCWAQKLCGECAVDRFYSQSDKTFSAEPNENYCLNVYCYLDKIISLIALMRSNDATWGKMKDYMKTKGLL